MYENILQQEQNRKNEATRSESANQSKKTEGLLSMLKGNKKESSKKETIQEKHKRVYG